MPSDQIAPVAPASLDGTLPLLVATTEVASGGSPLQRWMTFSLSALAVLTFLRPAGLNLTAFDVAAIGSFAVLLAIGKGLRTLPVPMVLSFLAMLVAGLASALAAVAPMATLTHWLQWALIAVVVVPLAASAVANGHRSPRFFALGIVWGTVPVIVYGLWDYLTNPPPYRAYRYGSLYGDPQVLAFHLAVALPLLAWAVSSPGKGAPAVRTARTLFYFLLTGGAMVVLYSSYSRTGVLASAVGLGVFFMGVGGRRRFILRSALVLVVGIVGIVVIGQILPALITQYTDGSRLMGRVSEAVGPGSLSREWRLTVASEAIHLAMESATPFGVGLDNYHLVSRHRQKPHNVFLLFLAEGGPLMMAGFLGVVLSFGIAIVHLITAEEDAGIRSVGAAIAASVAAFLVIAMFNTQSLNRLYWWILGAGVGVARLSSGSMREE
jgi:hypothetical protein